MSSGATAARRQRAVAAAVAAGLAEGLDVREPVVLYDVFSVVVHLAPAPVVVRVPTVLPHTVRADPAGQLAQMQIELAVCAWLAERAFPAVRPAAARPWVHDGQAMTAWELVEVSAGPVPEEDQGAAVARLHAVLADCPVELGWWFPLDASVAEGLDRLPGLLPEEDVERARAEWGLLRPLAEDPAAFSAAFPDAHVQPVHGDAPFYNLLPTTTGPVASDLEHVHRGLREWDLAGAPPAVRSGYAAEAARLRLSPLDDRLAAVAERGRDLQLLAVLPLDAELPGLSDGLAPLVQGWREKPPLDDLLG
ncbi:hypothetical protein ACU610_03080 [Geodermatophilus sp. URMC 61]|uniref:hypothetical protein n=1 Tax=Geodermatophilus sp. URMC 61 TaxID=3423411 RepID=UPI00406D1205